MKWEDAISAAIKSYFYGDSHAKYSEATGKFKYTKSYFDKMEDELLTKSEKAIKNAK